MLKRFSLFAVITLTLVLASSTVHAQEHPKKPFVVRVDLVGKHIRYRVDGFPDDDFLLALEKVHGHGANASVIVLLDRRVPITAIGNVDGTAAKAQLTNLRYYIVNYETKYMSEITMGRSIPLTTNPPEK